MIMRFAQGGLSAISKGCPGKLEANEVIALSKAFYNLGFDY